jgi:hypothetical protein
LAGGGDREEELKIWNGTCGLIEWLVSLSGLVFYNWDNENSKIMNGGTRMVHWFILERKPIRCSSNNISFFCAFRIYPAKAWLFPNQTIGFICTWRRWFCVDFRQRDYETNFQFYAKKKRMKYTWNVLNLDARQACYL